MYEFLSTPPPETKYIVYETILVTFQNLIYTCHIDLKLIKISLVFLKQWSYAKIFLRSKQNQDTAKSRLFIEYWTEDDLGGYRVKVRETTNRLGEGDSQRKHALIKWFQFFLFNF